MQKQQKAHAESDKQLQNLTQHQSELVKQLEEELEHARLDTRVERELVLASKQEVEELQERLRAMHTRTFQLEDNAKTCLKDLAMSKAGAAAYLNEARRMGNELQRHTGSLSRNRMVEEIQLQRMHHSALEQQHVEFERAQSDVVQQLGNALQRSLGDVDQLQETISREREQLRQTRADLEGTKTVSRVMERRHATTVAELRAQLQSSTRVEEELRLARVALAKKTSELEEVTGMVATLEHRLSEQSMRLDEQAEQLRKGAERTTELEHQRALAEQAKDAAELAELKAKGDLKLVQQENTKLRQNLAEATDREAAADDSSGCSEVWCDQRSVHFWDTLEDDDEVTKEWAVHVAELKAEITQLEAHRVQEVEALKRELAQQRGQLPDSPQQGGGLVF
eukprot:NODE_7238_length_1597_cov_3.147619.p1 GENE.NODE_7238_length_1597_cov_3.147619~~NODE_7238_length_1597_cov_3.147619.p1  ORF type:complete len:396 (+),score=146.23 NODE_7238_length_1597_cov_3.147619:184-1371(+)